MTDSFWLSGPRDQCRCGHQRYWHGEHGDHRCDFIRSSTPSGFQRCLCTSFREVRE